MTATASVDPYAGPALPEASREQVVATCAACHAYPPPESFAKLDWPNEVEQGLAFLKKSELARTIKPPRAVEINRYFMNRAPAVMPSPTRAPAGRPGRFEFRRVGYKVEGPDPPIVANVRFAHLFDDRRLDVLACDMNGGRVLALRPYEEGARPVVLAEGLADPGHVEVVDLDRDGRKDLLVAVLGNRFPTDDKVGRVVWLRGEGDGRFTPRTLADGLGRVADVQAADFDGDGDLDLVAAVFGNLTVGRVLYLENRTTDPSRPEFVPATLDERDGTINVPVADLNGDGRPDFVALISQEHETVVAFLNDGGGRFTRKTIYTAPHPAFSCSGLQLVDLDGDGDLDALLSNGDALDRRQFKPYQGIHWLENRGEYPFVAHRLDSVYGVGRAVAGDLDGDGDLDIAATAFLPGGHWLRLRSSMNLDAILILEQAEPGVFVRHSVERVRCDHPSCDLGDFDGDGRLDLVAGTCIFADGAQQAVPKGLDWIIVLQGMKASGR
jgi:hypothetical protein